MNLNANFLFENFNDVGSSIQCIMMNEIVEALAGLEYKICEVSSVGGLLCWVT